MSAELDPARAANELIGTFVHFRESFTDDDLLIRPYSPVNTTVFRRNLSASYPGFHVENGFSFEEEQAARKIQEAWRHTRIIRRHSFCQYGCEATDLVKRFISGHIFEEQPASKSHLILHFDINKTILISDKATGATQADMVNLLLSECAWGRMTLGPSWTPVGRLATDRPAKDPQLMTYRNFLDSFMFPYLEGGGADVQEENKRRKKECHARQRRFTNPGEPGEMFEGVFKTLVRNVTQPEPERHSLFQSGERRILPSFFELLLYLDRVGRDFTIVFRSFGSDIADIVEEMELFSTGQHPSYPGVQLAGQNRTDLRLTIPHHMGAYIRSGPGKDDTILALGVSDRVLSAPQVTKSLVDEDIAAHGGHIVTGFEAIHETICSLADASKRSSERAFSPPSSPLVPKSPSAQWIRRHRRAPNSAFAIRDYFPYWRQCNERPRAGKLLLVDQADPAVVQIFFDDNIFHSNAHIVDARDARSGEAIPFSIAKNSHLIRVEPVNAILDPMYFVRTLNEAELTILRRAELTVCSRTHVCAPKHDTVSPMFPFFRGKAFRGLQASSKSSVARVSLVAKTRWERALRAVLIMVRLSKALHEK